MYRRKISLIMGLITLLVMLLSYPFYDLWINEDFANKAFIPTVIMSLGIFCNSLGLISLTTISALGHVRFIGLLHTIELIIFIPSFYVLAQNFGIIGASAAWMIRSLLDFIILLNKEKSLFKKM